MSNKKGFFEESLESGTSFVKQTGKTAGKAAADTTKAVVSQAGLPVASDARTEDIVKDLYGTGKKNQQTGNDSSSNPQTTAAQTQANSDLPKSPEEQQKLQEIRTKLQKRHDEFYYEPLINLRKDKPEERPAEKVENEKQQEMVDLQKKEEKKPPPLAVQRGQRKTEQFPGGGG